MAVASANDTRVICAGLAALGLDGMFGVIVGRDDVPRPKPNPDVYLTAAARLGVAASDCLAFDNTDDGLASALAAGMDVIDVRTWTMVKPSRWSPAVVNLVSVTQPAPTRLHPSGDAPDDVQHQICAAAADPVRDH